jgi:hypothetical protein
MVMMLPPLGRTARNDVQEQEQDARLESLEFALNLLWKEVTYVKNALEDIKGKTD